MQDPYEHIEAYLEGVLSPEDKKAFEGAMLRDDMLRQAVEDYDLVDLIGEALVEQEIRGLVDAEVESGAVEEELPLRRIPNRLWPKLAAAVIVILLLWEFNMYMSGKVDDQEVEKRYAAVIQYYEPPTDTHRGATTVDSDLHTRALRNFELKRFSTAKEQLDSLKTLGILSPEELNFYMAHIAFRERDFAASSQFLASISGTSKNIESVHLLQLLIYYVTDDKARLEELCSRYSAVQEVCNKLSYGSDY